MARHVESFEPIGFAQIFWFNWAFCLGVIAVFVSMSGFGAACHWGIGYPVCGVFVSNHLIFVANLVMMTWDRGGSSAVYDQSGASR